MVQTFSTNSDNDIYIGQDGRLAIATGIDAVLQACKTASLAQLGEMVLATGLGIPNRETIWVGVPNYQLWELYLRKTLLSVPGVQSVKSLQINVRDNTLFYTVTIVTIYGVGSFSASVSQGA